MSETQLTISQVASQGGKARALALTAERRKEIGRSAIAARWNKNIPMAICEGEMPFAGTLVPCAVLEGGVRVLSERGTAKGFGLKRGGSTWQRSKEGGARMPVFASADNLKSFMDNDLIAALSTPVLYRPLNSPGSVAYGVKAELIPKVCDVWLKARDANAFRSKRQKEIAAQADLIMRGLCARWHYRISR